MGVIQQICPGERPAMDPRGSTTAGQLPLNRESVSGPRLVPSQSFSASVSSKQREEVGPGEPRGRGGKQSRGGVGGWPGRAPARPPWASCSASSLEWGDESSHVRAWEKAVRGSTCWGSFTGGAPPPPPPLSKGSSIITDPYAKPGSHLDFISLPDPSPQQTLLAPSSKYIQNPATSHHACCHIPVRVTMTSALNSLLTGFPAPPWQSALTAGGGFCQNEVRSCPSSARSPPVAPTGPRCKMPHTT